MVRTKGSDSGAGFTMVELLAVIAVIGMLMALLFPAFAQARKKSHRTVCLSNLRQAGMAALMYQGDHDGALPKNPYRWPAYPRPAYLPDFEPTSALERYGLTRQAAHCPTTTSYVDGFEWRFEMNLSRGDHYLQEADFRRVRPEPGSVLAYCYRHLTAGYTQRENGTTYTFAADERAGSYQIVRADGSAATIPAGRVAVWTYSRKDGRDVWNAPGTRTDFNGIGAQFDVFPDEPWPPRFVEPGEE